MWGSRFQRQRSWSGRCRFTHMALRTLSLVSAVRCDGVPHRSSNSLPHLSISKPSWVVRTEVRFLISLLLHPVWLPRKPRKPTKKKANETSLTAGIWSRFCLVLLWYYYKDKWSIGGALLVVNIRLEFCLVSRKMKENKGLHNFEFYILFLFWLFRTIGSRGKKKRKKTNNRLRIIRLFGVVVWFFFSLFQQPNWGFSLNTLGSTKYYLVRKLKSDIFVIF